MGTTHGHELGGKIMFMGGVCGAEWNRGEKNWDNYNSTINKMYFFKKTRGFTRRKITNTGLERQTLSRCYFY